MDAGQGRSALVLYGTETGTSQDLAEELSQLLERQLFDTAIQGLDAVHPVRYPLDLPRFFILLIVKRIHCPLIP